MARKRAAPQLEVVLQQIVLVKSQCEAYIAPDLAPKGKLTMSLAAHIDARKLDTGEPFVVAHLETTAEARAIEGEAKVFAIQCALNGLFSVHPPKVASLTKKLEDLDFVHGIFIQVYPTATQFINRIASDMGFGPIRIPQGISRSMLKGASASAAPTTKSA